MRLRKELWFGFILMALIVIPTLWFMPLSHMSQGHFGLLMLSLVVVAIMLGFPTAFTLMGMGVIFTWIAYRMGQAPQEVAIRQTLDLMVQRAYAVMTNDVLIAVPLFVFMGYLVERANLIERLFRSLHLAIGKIPGSLAVATLATCAVFATATGIIGAVVTLMGLLALPAMLKSGYNVKLSAGVITAGGTLGILIPPSVLLILYGATASVSVVQLYAGAFFPGLMLAGLYMAYVMLVAKLKPAWAPMPSEEERHVELPPLARQLTGGARRKTLPTLLGAIADSRKAGVPVRASARQLAIALLPAFALAVGALVVYRAVTTQEVVDTSGLQEMGSFDDEPSADEEGVQVPPEAKKEEAKTSRYSLDRSRLRAEAAAEAPAAPAVGGRVPAPPAFWIVLGILALTLVGLYFSQTFERLEVFKMMLGSFFPLAILILAVLGSIIFGWATPTEAAAMGAGGGLLLAAAYRRLSVDVVKESVFLTAKTTAMVCWLFVGSSIFSAAFALLGGQEIIERWVLSLNMTPTQFMLLAQFIIFILGWPLEWTEIIVIFMPIFLPLLGHFHIDPLFFGLLVALNLQTAFLSPPVAMAAFYLKGVAPKHVTLNQIFAGMMPFMAIQIFALALLYLFPQIGLWLPGLVYK
ncbi:MAG TPA: TRAP transporter large permease subunit [Anaeromyxobacteraceae bacterium]|nr:TRAP transporter large permease subunit [Anaeromyxobacteraceae bacterium]